jgi:flagellar biosynthesis/type III secretory pathway chaperone
MVERVAELLKALEVETALYRRLLEIVDRERRALLRSRRTEIEACTAEKRDLIDRLEAADRRRAEAVSRLAQQFGRSGAEVTLSLLARTLPDPHGKALLRCRSELLGLVAHIREENRRSAVLCRHVGELLRAAYGTLKGLATSGSVYHRGGRLQDARLNGKLVCDEI